MTEDKELRLALLSFIVEAIAAEYRSHPLIGFAIGASQIISERAVSFTSTARSFALGMKHEQ